MTDDVLKKPVHVALLRPTRLENLAASGKIDKTPFGVTPHAISQPLPVEQKEKPYKVAIPKAPNYAKAAKKQVQLRVLHDQVPPFPPEREPPCDTCRTAPCCRVFLVNITEMEYESGLYGDQAVKITPEVFNQLRSKHLVMHMIGAPLHTTNPQTSYYLDGKIGEPCPFLDEKNRCSIYDIRPRTCRVYSCVGDPRVTEGMRQGTEPLDSVSMMERSIKIKNGT